MIISISGTPKTGKTAVAKALARILGWSLVSLNKLAEKKKLYLGYDKSRRSRIVDLRGLKAEVRKLSKMHKNLILESHYSHDMPCDTIVVLRANPGELRKRMQKAGWTKAKTEENVEAEIMEVVKGEALEKSKTMDGRRTGARSRQRTTSVKGSPSVKVLEIDTTGRKPEWVAGEIVRKLKL